MSAGELRRILWVGGLAIAGAGLAVELWHWVGSEHGDVTESAVAYLSLSYEANVPTWYASSLLLCCALALGAIARQAERDRVHWWGLSATFGYMSVDEAVQIHEHLGGLIGTGGVLYFDWVVPASIIVAGLGVALLPFLRRLPATTRWRFVGAGLVYVGGALLMELPLGYWTERAGDDNLTYALIDLVEETLELAGASLFLLALWQYRRRERDAPAGEDA